MTLETLTMFGWKEAEEATQLPRKVHSRTPSPKGQEENGKEIQVWSPKPWRMKDGTPKLRRLNQAQSKTGFRQKNRITVPHLSSWLDFDIFTDQTLSVLSPLVIFINGPVYCSHPFSLSLCVRVCECVCSTWSVLALFLDFPHQETSSRKN